jgi:hypothetical protein
MNDVDYRLWEAQQGGNPVRIGGRLLFPSGARCDDWAMVREPPPADPAALADRRRAYLEARLNQVDMDTRSLDAALRGLGQPFKWPTARYGDPPEPKADGKKALAWLQAEAERLRAELATLEPHKEGQR